MAHTVPLYIKKKVCRDEGDEGHNTIAYGKDDMDGHSALAHARHIMQTESSRTVGVFASFFRLSYKKRSAFGIPFFLKTSTGYILDLFYFKI